MKLFTRIKISYTLVFVITVLLIGVSFYGISSWGVNTLEKQYDITDSGIELLYNPLKVLNNMTSSVIGELEKTIKEDPVKMEDSEYLDGINAQLTQYSAFLVIKKNGEINYNGNKNGKMSDAVVGAEHVSDDSSYYMQVQGSVPYHIKQRSFDFADGSTGEILIYTEIDRVIPQIKDLLIRVIVMAAFVLFITSGFAMMWLYQSIVKPLAKLKVAAENIKEGNLNFSVVADTDDEIGELCTAFEQMRIKLKEQIEISMQYEAENKELISNISHDLKTPMTAIKGYIEGIQDGVADTPEKMDKYMRTIYNKATDMERLIEELFLYSKLDSNFMNYSFAKVNLNDYFEDCVEEIQLDLESRDIELIYNNYADEDTVIIADPEQLKRVINNIIGNSVKYIGKKKGVIQIRIKDEPEFVQIELEDNGKGIAKNELPYIFDRCYRTDASRNSSQGGSGLGLSIAKKIIEEHGGKIWASSVEGESTTISFVIRKYKESVTYE